MTQHPKRYGTLEHVKEQKQILEKMIAEMPENQTGSTSICRICLKVFALEKLRANALLKGDYANGICSECARKESAQALRKRLGQQASLTRPR